MHRILERLDEVLSNVVILLYLFGMGLGTVSYFTGGLNVIAAAFAGLAVAVEMHSWLMQRRTYEAWGNLRQAKKSHLDEEVIQERMESFRSVGLIFLLLLAFSAFCSVMYTEATWHPTDTTLLPSQTQIIIRGLIVPLLFSLTALLVPLHTDAAAMLAKASHNLLDKTLRKTTWQWNRRVNNAVKRNVDLAPITIALLEDQGDVDGARRVKLLADGLDRAEGRAYVLTTTPGTVDALPTGPAPTSTYLRNVKGAHDGLHDGGWDGSMDSDPNVPAVVNGNGRYSGNGNRHDARNDSRAAAIAPARSVSKTAPTPIRSTHNGTRGQFATPPASSAATARDLDEWHALPAASDEDSVWEKPAVGHYAPEIVLEPAPTTKRAQAAREAAKKQHGKQRREWQARADAKGDPSASGSVRKQRIDANRPRLESQERFDRAVEVAVQLLIGRDSPIGGEPLHDFHSAKNRPLKRAVAHVLKRDHDDSDGCSERIVERAEARWRAMMEQGLAPTGQVDGEHDDSDLGYLDEVVYPGDAEGYGTTAFASDDLDVFTDVFTDGLPDGFTSGR